MCIPVQVSKEHSVISGVSYPLLLNVLQCLLNSDMLYKVASSSHVADMANSIHE